MYNPATRLLTILELLQSQETISGPEIAAKLEVEVRSVRRYITMLRDMGIPIESEKGRYGSYSLRPGYHVPPLMFTDSEVLAVALGLLVARQIGLASVAGVESAISKIERVLPETLQGRIQAFRETLTFHIPDYQPISDEMIAQCSLATHLHHRLWIAYEGNNGRMSERSIDIYGLVFHTGHWYAASYCHLRQDLRTFRLDRVKETRLLEDTFEPPPDFNALEHVLHSIASMPGSWAVNILLKTSMEKVRRYITADMAHLEAVGEGVTMTCNTNNIEWMARFLLSTGFQLRVYEPDELYQAMREIALSVLQSIEK